MRSLWLKDTHIMSCIVALSHTLYKGLMLVATYHQLEHPSYLVFRSFQILMI